MSDIIYSRYIAPLPGVSRTSISETRTLPSLIRAPNFSNKYRATFSEVGLCSLK